MQTSTSETESKSRDLSICVHHYTLRAPCPKGQGILSPSQKCRKIEELMLISRLCGHLYAIRSTKSVLGTHLIGGESRSASQSVSTGTQFRDQQYTFPTIAAWIEKSASLIGIYSPLFCGTTIRATQKRGTRALTHWGHQHPPPCRPARCSAAVRCGDRQNSRHLNGSLIGSPVEEAREREVSRSGVCAVTKA